LFSFYIPYILGLGIFRVAAFFQAYTPVYEFESPGALDKGINSQFPPQPKKLNRRR
jgi:hypothetical protein